MRKQTFNSRGANILRAGAVSSLALAAALFASASALAAEKLKVAFFGFELINTSIDPTGEGELRRIGMVGDELTKLLTESGRYEAVPLSDALKQKIASGSNITGCNGCQLDYAREAGADLAVWGTVQKVSNLILNENLYMDDAKTGASYFGRSVDIRGNTDESWMRGIRYLVKNYLLTER